MNTWNPGAREDGPLTFDYTDAARHWGHDLTYTVDGNTLRANGWGGGAPWLPPEELGALTKEQRRQRLQEVFGDKEPRPMQGDFLLLTNKKYNSTVRYRVETIGYYFDPQDMWRATLVFVPREEPLG